MDAEDIKNTMLATELPTVRLPDYPDLDVCLAGDVEDKALDETRRALWRDQLAKLDIGTFVNVIVEYDRDLSTTGVVVADERGGKGVRVVYGCGAYTIGDDASFSAVEGSACRHQDRWVFFT